jgi:hypothetical protein
MPHHPGRKPVPQNINEKHAHVRGEERRQVADDFAARYTRGESIRNLAASSNRSYGFVHRILSQSGVTFRGRGNVNRTPRNAEQPSQ